MNQSLSSSTGPHDSDETEEPVLVEAQEFSDDDESFAKEIEEDDRLNIDYDDEEEEGEHEESDFEEDDDEEMSLVRVGLHDLNTLRHLYRFGLLATHNIRTSQKYPPSNDLNNKISIWRGDITKLEIDVIVNAANKSLLGGGGVDGAIHKAAGQGLLKECRRHMGCVAGDAKLTGAYNLPAKKIIHTVGPIYFTDEAAAPRLLASCYWKSLELAKLHSMKSIAFPSLSTGIYGYPIRDATSIAAEAVRTWLDFPVDPQSSSSPPNASVMDRVIFCVFSAKDEDVYNGIVPKFFPPSEEDLAAEKEQEEDSDSALKEETDRHGG